MRSLIMHLVTISLVTYNCCLVYPLSVQAMLSEVLFRHCCGLSNFLILTMITISVVELKAKNGTFFLSTTLGANALPVTKTALGKSGDGLIIDCSICIISLKITADTLVLNHNALRQ